MQKKLMLLALLAFGFGTTYAQYPQLTPAAKARVDSMQKAWAKHQAEVWAKAEPIVKKEAAEGRPYVPWAGRPTDLPQAKIPAFPGAEGG
ncbi:MAG: polysaccharide lyase, partial [Prevotella sp.]|nr:polysaccharide lyase [Prevotella sp.]